MTFSRQHFFQSENTTRRLWVQLLNSDNKPTLIVSIRSSMGNHFTQAVGINRLFMKHYRQLHRDVQPLKAGGGTEVAVYRQ